MAIIRAAVYAGRTGSHGGSFVGSDGETYPDVSKAFSNWGNLRPCPRCKSNKQGVSALSTRCCYVPTSFLFLSFVGMSFSLMLLLLVLSVSSLRPNPGYAICMSRPTTAASGGSTRTKTMMVVRVPRFSPL